MTCPVALFMAVVTLFALAFVGSICAMLGLRINDAIVDAVRRVLA